jgi:hypothetical protein
MSLQAWVPVIGLIGTLVVAFLGFYQWRRQASNANRSENAAKRREAYEGLWQKLEQINLDLRERRADNPSLFHRLREVNTYFVSQSLYFDDNDQLLINQYIAAMSRLREKVFTSDDADVTSVFRATMITLPVKLDKEIREAAEEVDRLRAKIKSKVQKIAASV